MLLECLFYIAKVYKIILSTKLLAWNLYVFSVFIFRFFRFETRSRLPRAWSYRCILIYMPNGWCIVIGVWPLFVNGCTNCTPGSAMRVFTVRALPSPKPALRVMPAMLGRFFFQKSAVSTTMFAKYCSANCLLPCSEAFCHVWQPCFKPCACKAIEGAQQAGS